jgi:hypothetical protein
VELTFGLPSHGLALVRIEADPNGSGDAVVHVRQGSRTLPLRLSHSAQFASTPREPQQEANAPTPARPYAAWNHHPGGNRRLAGVPGHRIPGTVPATAQR